MSANEVLHRLASMARGDVTDFWAISPQGAPYFDFEACKEAGLLHLVKKVTFKDGEVTAVEFYDSQAALRDLGRKHNLFTDSVDLKSDGKPIRIHTIEAVPPSDEGVADDADSDQA